LTASGTVAALGSQAALIRSRPAPLASLAVTGVLVVLSAVAGLIVGRVAMSSARLGGSGRGLLGHPLLLSGLVAAAWVGVSLRFGWSLTTPAVDAFTAGLVALAATDIDRHLLPKRLIYPTGALAAACVVLATVIDAEWSRLGVAVAGGVGCYLVLLALHLVNRSGLGFGDVRLGGFIGFVLGWLGLRYLLLGFVAGNLGGVAAALVLLGAGRIGWRTPIPYGAALAGGALLAVFAGAAILG
jgi:leader peptidase (prepilin peptidase) / N-methyltransferase